MALRAALERCKGHRFTTFWSSRDEPGDIAKELIGLRRAAIIQIAGADEFFTKLAEKVLSLEEIGAPHPLSSKVAAATLKRYIVDDRHRIRLHDLVQQETERAYSILIDKRFLGDEIQAEPQSLMHRLDKYNANMETTVVLMVHKCYWGGQQHIDLWTRCLERMAGAGGELITLDTSSDLRLYPAWLMLYAGGMAAVAGGHYQTLQALTEGAQARKMYNSTLPAAMIWSGIAPILDKVVRRLPG